MTQQGAGYSGTPLVTKLGIKPGSRVKVLGAPAHFPGLLVPLPDGAVVSPRLRAPVDIFHLFTTSRARLRQLLRQGLGEIRQDGAIWVSWPKKSSGVASQVTQDVIREEALPMTLVDIKVCAVDETWSALKLVIRKCHRK